MPYKESQKYIKRIAQTLCILAETSGELLDKLICLPAILIGVACIACSLLLTVKSRALQDQLKTVTARA